MESENRLCQNCKQNFVIDTEDFQFYEKIQVPAPTWCPECRLIRRLLFFNERTIYKRACDLCRKDFMSIFPKDSQYTVYCSDCWHSDSWDPMSYGREYDFSRPFFEQLADLFKTVPQIGRNVTALTNSDYCNAGTYLKNCYLVFNSDYNEECMFSTYLERSKQSLDLYMADLCEFCYGSSNLFKDYRVRFSSNCNECMEVSFSRNLVGCSNCFGCVNLRNKSYHFFNEPCTKEEYARRVAEYNLGSWKVVCELEERLNKFAMGFPRKHAEGLNNSGVTGDYVFNSKNTFASYEVGGAEDCKYCHFLFLAPTKDSYDYTMWGGGAERMYECMGTGGGAKDIKFCANSWLEEMNAEYSRDFILGAYDVFGCIGVKKQHFCILNKQYEEAEYCALRAKIIEHMNTMPYVDKQGRAYRYGEFFPPELSPFGYNESLAQIHFQLDAKEASAKGYIWKGDEERAYQITLVSEQLPDNITEVADSILNEVVECAHKGSCRDQCPGVFRITPQELEFYRRQSLPLPRLCPNCRHYGRLRDRNPLARFWHRRCACGGTRIDTNEGEQINTNKYTNPAIHLHGDGECPNEFETSYSPELPEIVYCESCYNAEVA